MSDNIEPDPSEDAVAAAPEAKARPRPSPVPVEAEKPPAGPVSAAGRARRIGGRPVIPTATATPEAATTVRRRPAPPSPGAGKHLATPPPSAPKPEPVKKERVKKERVRKARPVQESAAPQAGSSSLVPWIPSIVLGAVAVLFVVFIAVAAHGVYYGKGSVSAASRNEYQEEALAAAKTCLATINTYDYRKVATNEAAALACTTGPFTANLKTTFEKTIKVKAPPAKATQTAQVNQAGIREVSPNGKQIDVLIFGQLAITNVQTGTTPRYDPFGTIVTMDRVGSKWLVAKYEDPDGS